MGMGRSGGTSRSRIGSRRKPDAVIDSGKGTAAGSAVRCSRLEVTSIFIRLTRKGQNPVACLSHPAAAVHHRRLPM